MKTKMARLGFLLALAAVSCFAADITWQPRHVTLAEAAKVGGTVLPAGEYKVEHLMRGEEHIMVFTNVDEKKLRAESKCHMLKNPEKARRTEQAYALVDGHLTLKTLIFKGDKFVHELY